MKKLLGFISFLLVLAGSVSAKVVLPAIFSDNMVLQQNAQVNLWGKATPGERVSVKTSWTDKAVTTKAAADGKWTVKLKTPAAAKGQSVTVSGENSITINNVLMAIFAVFLTAFGDKLHADSFHLLRTDLFGCIHSVSRAAQFVVERAKPVQMDTVAVLHKE